MAESQEHIIKGEAGFISSGGLTSQATWTDRSWLGGLRTFTVAATAQTGVAALENPAQQLYRLNLTAFQPYVGDRRLSAAGRAVRRVPQRPPRPELGGRVRGLAGLGAGAAAVDLARLFDLAPPGVRLRHRLGPRAGGIPARFSASPTPARSARWRTPATAAR